MTEVKTNSDKRHKNDFPTFTF